jgi:hypothetical protein
VHDTGRQVPMASGSGAPASALAAAAPSAVRVASVLPRPSAAAAKADDEQQEGEANTREHKQEEENTQHARADGRAAAGQLIQRATSAPPQLALQVSLTSFRSASSYTIRNVKLMIVACALLSCLLSAAAAERVSWAVVDKSR